MRFAGENYLPPRHEPRLTSQHQRLRSLMEGGEWRTLSEIAQQTGDPEASMSAQLRHLRKKRFGGHRVERRHEGNGLYKYRVTTLSGPTFTLVG